MSTCISVYCEKLTCCIAGVLLRASIVKFFMIIMHLVHHHAFIPWPIPSIYYFKTELPLEEMLQSLSFQTNFETIY